MASPNAFNGDSQVSSDTIGAPKNSKPMFTGLNDGGVARVEISFLAMLNASCAVLQRIDWLRFQIPTQTSHKKGVPPFLKKSVLGLMIRE